MIVKSLILLCAVGLSAADKTCPDESSGVYPLCTCKDFESIFRDDECVKVNRAVCPEPAVQTQFGCRCPDEKDFFDDYYWLCRTKLYLPTASPISTTTPAGHYDCPAFTQGKWPDCQRIPCPNAQYGEYEPFCSRIIPDTHERVCPPGETGTPPFCSVPCPRFYTRRVRFENGTTVHPDTIRLNSNIKYNYTCEPLPCSKQRGWTGEFMPNCTYTPFCPDGFPGNYPYCNKYATSSTALPTVRTTTTTRTTAQPIVRTATRGNVRLKGRLDSRISTDSSLPSYRNSNRNNLV